MNKNKTLAIALAALFSSSLALADSEVSGKMVLEQGSLLDGGTLKNEMKYKLYVDGDITDNATYHAELQGSSDSDKVGGYSGEYTQNANIRELYTDITGGDWDLRLGKQQIVWGTADGMKLLDIINPTDYAEMAQDQMEDSRIPVWAINMESGSIQAVISEPRENVFAGLNRGTELGVRSNNADGSDKVYAGTDEGNAFLMMGPDTITGATDGFLNIVPDLGSVAGGFGGNFMPLGAAPNELGGLKGMVYDGQGGMTDGMSDLLSSFSVDAFTIKRDPVTMAPILDTDGIAKSSTINELNDSFVAMQLGKAYANQTYSGTAGDFVSTYVFPSNSTDPQGNDISGQSMVGQFSDMNFIGAIVGMACGNPGYGDFGGQISCAQNPYYNYDSEGNVTGPNADNTGWLATEAEIGAYTTAVAADFATDIVIDENGNTMKLGDMFTGEAVLNGFGAMFGANLATFGDGDTNSAFEYMTNTGFRTFDTFVNARSEYVYNMPASDSVDFAIKTSQTTKSGVNYSLNFSNSYDKNPIINLRWKNNDNETLTQETVSAPLTMVVGEDESGDPIINVMESTYIELRDSTYDASTGAGVYGGGTGQSAILEFEQTVVRTKNIGGSFDTTFETAGLGPVVIRGEALYTRDGMQPVMSKSSLSVGDLVGALQMKAADRFKFVLGADITVLTNMLISGQYISDRNLDFIDSTTEYTTDYATMHLSNGFNKAIEDKHYLSLFFSKPFGKSGEHRWNNITMLEEGVGEDAYWNRFDVSYGLSDDVEGTIELNNYFGNANTQFGQLKDASNMQVGVKYSF